MKVMRGNVKEKYTREDLEEVLQIVSSTISRCGKNTLKFAEVPPGTHSLIIGLKYGYSISIAVREIII
jgi:hypothetical protein